MTKSLKSFHSSSLSRYAPRSSEFKTVKYILLAFILLNIGASIWVCIFATQQAEWESNKARVTADAEGESAVSTWTAWTISVVIFADCASVILAYFGVWKENQRWLLALSLLAFIFSIYGISSVYTRGSITCFVIPFVIGTLAAFMAWMIKHEEHEYEVARAHTLRTAAKQIH